MYSAAVSVNNTAEVKSIDVNTIAVHARENKMARRTRTCRVAKLGRRKLRPKRRHAHLTVIGQTSGLDGVLEAHALGALALQLKHRRRDVITRHTRWTAEVQKVYCQKWDSNPRLENQTAT